MSVLFLGYVTQEVGNMGYVILAIFVFALIGAASDLWRIG